jgi:putative transposase
VCLLVMIGVRADSTEELVALDDGHRESTESWADLLRSCKRRGMRAPVLAVGDGALGFWAAVRTVFPETREQRCWFHKIANVLNVLPNSAQPGGRPRRPRSGTPKTRRAAKRLHGRSPPSTAPSGPRQPRRSPHDLDVLLAFYDYPAEHWVHLRTTNPIWVLDLPAWVGRCFPGQSWKRPALTLNAIDAKRLSWIRTVGPAA